MKSITSTKLKVNDYISGQTSGDIVLTLPYRAFDTFFKTQSVNVIHKPRNLLLLTVNFYGLWIAILELCFAKKFLYCITCRPKKWAHNMMQCRPKTKNRILSHTGNAPPPHRAHVALYCEPAFILPVLTSFLQW